MTHVHRILLFSSLTVWVLASASPALAGITIEQSQNGYVKVVAECSGNDCTSSVKVSTTQDQSQQFTRTSISNNEWESKKVVGDTWRHRSPMDAQAKVSWSQRGGTCYIRYTENFNRYYKYTTQTACDNGELTIGGLRRGRSYRFQVKQNDGAWGSPVVRIAS